MIDPITTLALHHQERGELLRELRSRRLRRAAAPQRCTPARSGTIRDRIQQVRPALPACVAAEVAHVI